jgi:hypothetical protein
MMMVMEKKSYSSCLAKPKALFHMQASVRELRKSPKDTKRQLMSL